MVVEMTKSLFSECCGNTLPRWPPMVGSNSQSRPAACNDCDQGLRFSRASRLAGAVPSRGSPQKTTLSWAKPVLA
ncbi:hypothetical protein CGRA01v4_10186 [Colletotrichum graminicola]|nr:hypothetical protein CGRA01v4_10186 [Colletotrichum graminicola]